MLRQSFPSINLLHLHGSGFRCEAMYSLIMIHHDGLDGHCSYAWGQQRFSTCRFCHSRGTAPPDFPHVIRFPNALLLLAGFVSPFRSRSPSGKVGGKKTLQKLAHATSYSQQTAMLPRSQPINAYSTSGASLNGSFNRNRASGHRYAEKRAWPVSASACRPGILGPVSQVLIVLIFTIPRGPTARPVPHLLNSFEKQFQPQVNGRQAFSVSFCLETRGWLLGWCLGPGVG